MAKTIQLPKARTRPAPEKQEPELLGEIEKSDTNLVRLHLVELCGEMCLDLREYVRGKREPTTSPLWGFNVAPAQLRVLIESLQRAEMVLRERGLLDTEPEPLEAA